MIHKHFFMAMAISERTGYFYGMIHKQFIWGDLVPATAKGPKIHVDLHRILQADFPPVSNSSEFWEKVFNNNSFIDQIYYTQMRTMVLDYLPTFTPKIHQM